MKNTVKKMKLGRETIKTLGSVELEHVAGGLTAVVGGCGKTQLNCPTLATCAAQGCLG